MQTHSCTVDSLLPDPDGMRLDRYVAEVLGLLSRSQIKARELEATVNGRAVKISRKLVPGDILVLTWNDPETSELLPEDLPLSVIYEDDRVIVIDKAQGLVVHPGAGNRQGTLANALLFRRLSKGLSAEGFRPGIVHRLDKDTSGVIIAAWDDAALSLLQEQFRLHKTRKIYVALVKGNPREKEGRIETLIGRDQGNRKRFAVVERGGKNAITYYKVVRSFPGYSLLLVRLKTGRTHQIRVHMKYLGCPILGDPIYAPKDKLFPEATLMLHARSLSVRIPLPQGPLSPRALRFRSPLPLRFRAVLNRLKRLQPR